MTARAPRTSLLAVALLLLACGARGVVPVEDLQLFDIVLEMRADGGSGGMQDVVGLGVYSDSTVVVGDAGNEQVLRFNTDGTVAARAGGRGSTAGEYQRLQWVGVCDDSVLLVHDIGLSRLSQLSPRLQPMGMRSIPKAFDSRDVAGCLSDSRVLILNDSLAYPVAGVLRRPLSLVAYNWRTGHADTLRKFAGTQVNYVRHLGTAIAVPLGERTLVATSGKRIVVAESNLDSLWQYDGARWQSTALRNLPSAVRPSAIDDQRARLRLGWAPRTAQDRAFAPALLAETKTARIAPRVDALVASDDGTSWVGLKPSSDGLREWIAYDLQGQPQARTRFVWTFEPRVVRGSTWWGVERDSIGVESLVRYRIEAKR